MTTIRALRTAKVTLSRTFYIDEMPEDATGSVVVTIARMDGTIVQSGNATGPTDSAYSFTFNGSDTLDWLIVSWAATVAGDAIVMDQDLIEVVGGFYFSLSEGRAVDSALSSTTKYPTADLIQHRIETEDECERITGQAWVPRFCRETLSGTRSQNLQVTNTMIRAVRSLTINGTAISTGSLGFSNSGLIYVDTGTFASVRLSGSRNVVVEYEHGHDRPTPDILRAAKIRFKSLTLQSKSALPDRAERLVTVDAGTVLLASPGRDKTGIPEVDAAYGRAPDQRPGFG